MKRDWSPMTDDVNEDDDDEEEVDYGLQEAIRLSITWDADNDDEDLQKTLNLSMESEQEKRLNTLKCFQEERQKEIEVKITQSYNVERISSDIVLIIISQLNAESVGNFFLASKMIGLMILKELDAKPFLSISFQSNESFDRLYEAWFSPLSRLLAKSIENIRIMKYRFKWSSGGPHRKTKPLWISRTRLKYLEFFITQNNFLKDSIEEIVRKYVYKGIRIIFYVIVNEWESGSFKVERNRTIQSFIDDFVEANKHTNYDDFSLFYIKEMQTQLFIDNYRLIPNPPDKSNDMLGRWSDESIQRYINELRKKTS